MNYILTHINSSPQRSPLVSFTTSYAIARGYALFGPSGPATRAMPGFVYCVDLNQLSASASVALLDPISEIAGINGGVAHAHNGGPDLIEQIAKTVTIFSHPLQRSGGTCANDHARLAGSCPRPA